MKKILLLLLPLKLIAQSETGCGKVCVSTYQDLQLAVSNNSISEIYISGGTYIISKQINILRPLTIRGAGATTILKLDTSLKVPYCFYIPTRSNIAISDLTIDGQSPVIDVNIISVPQEVQDRKGIGYQYGIFAISGVSNLRVENVDFYNLNHSGLTWCNSGGGSGNFKLSLIVDNCSATNCYYGFETKIGEYAQFGNITALRCIAGIAIRSGNITVSNSHFLENVINCYIGSSANNAHGGFSNCSFNHGKGIAHRSLYADSTSVAETFTGCMFYDGNIELNSAWGFNFTGCQIACAVIVNNGTQQQISSSVFYNAYGAGQITHTGTGSISLKNNFWYNGASATNINN